MPTIRTPTAKGAALNTSETEAIIKSPSVAKASNYNLTAAHNREIHELASGVTATLPTASGSLTETDDFIITLLASGDTPSYVGRNSQTINGVAADLTLMPGQSVTVVMNAGTTAFYTLGSTPIGRNHFINGGFDVWQSGTSDATPTTTSDYYLPDMFYINSSGASLDQVERTTSVRTGAKSKYALLLTGAASVTTVRVGYRVESIDVPKLSGTVTYSGWVYNGSGADFTPQIIINTADVADTFSSVTNRLAATNLQSCTDAAWSYVSYSVDISGYTNLTNGFEVQIQIPSGSLVASDTVRLAELKLELGAIATEFTTAGSSYAEELSMCQRYYYVLATGTNKAIGIGFYSGAAQVDSHVHFPQTMRTTPTLVATSGTNYYLSITAGVSDPFNSFTLGGSSNGSVAHIFNSSEASGTAGYSGLLRTNNSSSSIAFNARL